LLNRLVFSYLYFFLPLISRTAITTIITINITRIAGIRKFVTGPGCIVVEVVEVRVVVVVVVTVAVVVVGIVFV
jgi:hypothetical protein